MKYLLFTLAILFSSTTSAAIIELSTNSIDVSAGDNITIDINIVDAVEFDFLTFNFTFDNSLLTFVDETNPAVHLRTEDIDASLGILYLTLDSYFDFVIYEGSFLLTSLNFVAQNVGTASFNAEFNSWDSFLLGFDDLGTPEIRTASVNAPSTALLSLLMLAGLFIRRKHTQFVTQQTK